MYYLLEDNRIIDSENLPKNWEIFNISFDRMYVKIFEDIIITQTFDIKKQSENVYDLIEKGDLITEKRIWCNEEIYVIANVWSKEDKLIHCFRSTLFDNDVYAIYKPDENGNYIKVWEKKEDE